MTFSNQFYEQYPQAWPKLQKLMERGCTFLGSSLAIMGGAMTWVSNPKLVSATSEAGGFGVLACGSMPPETLRTEIQKTHKQTSLSFGVNLILLHPQIEDLIQVCIDEQVSHVVFAGGLPSEEQIQRLKKEGVRVIGFAPALILARKLIRSGIDALIIEGSEAGGHVGSVSTGVLAQEILPHVRDVPVFVAGGIGHGHMVLKYLEMGAAGVQLGTLLACSTESPAHPLFKKAFIKASSRHAILSPQLDPRFPVIPVRALGNKGMRAFVDKQREVIQKFDAGTLDREAAQLEIEHFWAGALRRAVLEGDVENGSLMAGQSVGLVKEVKPLRSVFEHLLQEALALLS